MTQRFVNALGEPIEYDGVSPLDWRIAVYMLVKKGGQLLMLAPRPGEKWQLPGGAAAARECLEETGYRFHPAHGNATYLGEQFFFHRSRRTYHHSLLFLLEGWADESRVEGWQPEYGGPDRARWVNPNELTEASVHANHWPALVQAGLVA